MTSFDTCLILGQQTDMRTEFQGPGDSLGENFGEIPGSNGAAAFRAVCPDPSPVPVVLAVPHAGREYPQALTVMMRNPGLVAVRLEDRYVDKLASAAAEDTGAALLVACAPRAMVDLNRSPEDIDPEMIEGLAPGRPKRSAGLRMHSGLGVVPRRLPGLGEIWNRRIDAASLQSRIAQIHGPYHTMLDTILRRLRDRWGAALLLDVHSMPPLPARLSGASSPKIVLGDRFGASSAGSLVAAAFNHLAGEGMAVAHNRPYAGGYVLERHASPSDGIHAIQVEICRSLYLDSRLSEPSAECSTVSRLLSGLVRCLAAEVSAMGQGSKWGLAAE